MAKLVHDSVLDGAFAVLDNANLMTVCSSEPTTRAHAVTSNKLASIAISASDFTDANGSSGGRKCTITAQSSVSVDSTGSAVRICLVDASNLLYKTECSAQSLSSGNKVNIPAWKVTINDPT